MSKKSKKSKGKRPEIEHNEASVERLLARKRSQAEADRRFREERVAQLHARSTHARKMRGAEFFLDLPEAQPVLWGAGTEVLWIDGEPLMICGDDGTGKSTIDHQLIACRLGLRDTLLGYEVAEADKPILYLAMDRPEQARRAGHRLFPQVVVEEFRDVLAERVHVWRGPLPIDVLSGPDALADWIQSEFGDVGEVHADSLKDLAARLTDDAVGSGVNVAIQELVSRGINWVGLHHQRKANGENRKPDALADVYGSRWLTAGQGSVLMLTKPGESDKDQVELRQLKEPADRIRPMLLNHQRASGQTFVVEEKKDIYTILDRGHELTLNEIAAEYFGRTKDLVTNAERKAVERRLSALIKRDEVEKTPAKKGGSGGSTPARYRLLGSE
jgi:replicative DNA helicase